MKKFLLLMIGFVCVSIGAWAQPGGQDGYEIQHGTWHNTEKVAVIHLTQPGKLAEALAALEVKANETDPNTGELTKPAQDLNGYTMIKIDSKQAGPQGAVVDIELTADDIAALSSISTAVTTIDLQDLKNVDGNGDVSAFTFTHSNVRNLILPDNWTKEEVNTCAMGIAAVDSNLGSCISQATFPSLTFDNGKQLNNGLAGTKLIAYINQGNTLDEVIDHAYYDGDDHKNMKLAFGGHYGSDYTLDKVYAVVISGNPVARDLCNSTGSIQQTFVEGGHFEFNEPLLETEDQNRTLKGDAARGALSGINHLISLDLSEAHVLEDNIEDLTLKYMDIFTKETIELKIPNYIETIPADFLNVDNDIRELCIPGNIKYIKTRAFFQGHIDHIWTTSNEVGDRGRTDLAYDNGIMTLDDELLTINSEPTSAPLPYESYDQYKWGTYTLPSNLQLIERFAFGGHNKQDGHVKDLYVLNVHAPECHVDAFPSLMCAGNLAALNQEVIRDNGIISRDAYTNNPDEYSWVTILHFPRESTTPDIQRYQDVTRKYSVATADVDGKGATIYYPNLSELARSYMQGTYGYLWDAWDPERNTDGSNSFLHSEIDNNAMPYNMYVEAGQQIANEEYLRNANQDVDKAYTSFYDVTNNGDLPQPTDLKEYYTVYWDNVKLNDQGNGTKLYDQADTENVLDDQGNVVTRVQDKYINGVLQYVLDNETPGLYVREESQEYVPNNSGNYVKEYAYVPYQDVYGPNAYPNHNLEIETGKVYRRDADGNYLTLPKDGQAFYETQDQTYYVLQEVYREADVVNHPEDANAQKYSLETVYSYRLANEGEEGDRYSVEQETVNVTRVTDSNDYRGWHQFILGSYSANTTEEMQPIRSYITDSDWWTICSPYDVRYSEMKVLFGNPAAGKIPYLSKLLYVVRDVENTQITLMFSKNLMVYKEQFKTENGPITGYEQFPDAEGKFSGRVHGYIDESEAGKWSQEELANDPVILHAGVPYMIKPEIPTDANRQFDVYRKQINQGLTDWRTAILSENFYDRLVEARSKSGDAQKQLIYNGEYQVPAYVINNVTGNYHENTLGSEGSLTITMNDGSNFTYPALNEFTFKGNTYQMEIRRCSWFCYRPSWHLLPLRGLLCCCLCCNWC